MADRSLGSASSIPSTHDVASETPGRGGEAEPSDWRYWLERAHRAWLARSEQLTLFEDWVA